jgi:hypothetical protein
MAGCSVHLPLQPAHLSRARGLLFYRLLQQAAGTDATAQGADRSRDVVELVETL